VQKETIAPPIAERRAEPAFRAVLCPFFIEQVKHVAGLKILTCIQVIIWLRSGGG